MPRLEGKRSNSSLYIVLLIIVLLIVLLAVDYLNFVNLIPNFGPA